MDSQPEYLRINVQDGQEMENTENGETRKAKTVIVGSRGRMGKMLLERAKDADMECTGLDQPLERPEIERALADVELVFLCVPAKVIGEVLQKDCALFACKDYFVGYNFGEGKAPAADGKGLDRNCRWYTSAFRPEKFSGYRFARGDCSGGRGWGK